MCLRTLILGHISCPEIKGIEGSVTLVAAKPLTDTDVADHHACPHGQYHGVCRSSMFAKGCYFGHPRNEIVQTYYGSGYGESLESFTCSLEGC